MVGGWLSLLRIIQGTEEDIDRHCRQLTTGQLRPLREWFTTDFIHFSQNAFSFSLYSTCWITRDMSNWGLSILILPSETGLYDRRLATYLWIDWSANYERKQIGFLSTIIKESGFLSDLKTEIPEANGKAFNPLKGFKSQANVVI